MPLPSISVIIPNYNHAHRLPQSFEALLGQSVKPDEIIVVDDASTDNSVEVISEFAKKDPSFKLIRNEKNLGAQRSSLKGLEYATSDYIIFNGADDYLLPGFFEKTLTLLSKHPEAGVCSTLCRRVNENDEYIDVVPEAPYVSEFPCYTPPEKMRGIVTNRNDWDMMTLTTVYNHKFLVESNAYSPDAGQYMDAFSAVLMALKHGACFVPEELGVFRLISGSTSANARNDPQIILGYFKPMWRLMETTYADNFPPEVRESIKKRQLYTYGAIALDKLDRSHSEFLDEMKILFNESTLLDHMLLFGTRWLRLAQYWITKVYLYLRLRPVDRSIFIRLFHRYKK
jgi:glycosyltransferase involved in cell wall biosynthesis